MSTLSSSTHRSTVRGLALRLVRLAVPSMKMIRLTAYLTVACTGVAAAGSHAVYADAREVGYSMGHELAKLPDVTSGAHEIHLNGATMYRASAHTAESVHEVVARFSSYCAENPGGLGHAMDDLPAALREKTEVKAATVNPLAHGVITEESSDRGMVVCFADDQGERHAGLKARLDAFRATGDLASFGHFRYAFVETSKSGGSHVVTTWSNGELNPGKMFPANGDAPGEDSRIAPRPAASRRLLAAAVSGTPYVVRVYRAASSASELRAFYDAEMKQRGFRVAKSSDDVCGYLHEDGTELIASFAKVEGGASVTLVESRGSRVDGVRADGSMQ